MQQFSLCFGKVKKDCLKFIKSQETKADKFKNKERMIKSFLIPLCFWINKKANKKRPYFVGLAGGQGTGKTTISSLIKIILIKYFKLKVFKISIDDFYKTRKERISLSKRIHPMLLIRGVPGTHDINMMLSFFKKANQNHKIKTIIKPALESLDELKNDKFDMVFIDADKMNYREYYEKSLKLINRGGLIIIDNVLWHGEVADEKNDDKFTINIREFNKFVSEDKRVEQIIIPLGDGMSVCRVL